MPFKDSSNGMPEPASDQANARTNTPYTGYPTGAQEYPSDNSMNGYDAQAPTGPDTDSQKHLSVFFSGDGDNDLEAMLRPLIDAQYTPPVGSPAPGNRGLFPAPNTQYGRQGALQPPLGDTPGLGPFPTGAAPDPTPEQQSLDLPPIPPAPL
ncbi:MAG: hypothetical protein ABJA50_06095, partial [Chloroflexota bacterium]